MENPMVFEVTPDHLGSALFRKEYGLKWSAVTEAGGLVVADDVKLAMNVEMIKQS